MAAKTLELLPGDTTALGALGAAAHQLGNHEEFIAVGEIQQGANSAKHLVTIDSNRLVFQDCMVAAYAATGNAEMAMEYAVATLTEDPAGLRSWPELIESLNSAFGVAATDLLVPIALLDESAGFLEPLVRSFPPSAVAEFCAAYLHRGGQAADAILVGLLVAAKSGNDDAFAAIVPAVSNLDRDTRNGLAERVAAGGRPELAAKLRPEPVAANH
jgi:hypothetical protein